MKIEGNPAKPWQLYRTDLNDRPIGEPLAEADTQAELWTIHKQRQDYTYAIFHNRERVDRS
jgi:hypothetical protein